MATEVSVHGVTKTNNTVVSKIEGTDIYDRVFSSHDVEIGEVHCHDCPYGGHCGSTTMVGSKANYWGLVEKKRVSFYRCPETYCCSESNGCEECNTCGADRYGTLCGSGSIGFYETMFSSKCILNRFP